MSCFELKGCVSLPAWSQVAYHLADMLRRVPARQARWVARVLSGRSPPLPGRGAMEADAAAFYELLERASVPVRHTHCQARALPPPQHARLAPSTPACSGECGHCCQHDQGEGTCGMHVSSSPMHAHSSPLPCVQRRQAALPVHGLLLNMLVSAHITLWLASTVIQIAICSSGFPQIMRGSAVL